MNESFKVACIQNCARPDVGKNLDEADELVRAAHRAGADLVCLPEFFSCLELTRQGFQVGTMPEAEHPVLAHYRGLARELGTWTLLGSLAVEAAGGKAYNRSFMIDASGNVVARYDKIHLFDVDLADGESYRESETFLPGDEAMLAPTPWGLVGLSVCYDLRFAYLYRALAQAGARYLTVPAAFAKTTGQAHWHILIRARAIETGCYVFAPCQYGEHGLGRKTYGHSLIVDPWGRVLADGGEGPGYVLAEIDPAKVDEARRMIPSPKHDRPFSGPVPAALGRAAGSSDV